MRLRKLFFPLCALPLLVSCLSMKAPRKAGPKAGQVPQPAKRSQNVISRPKLPAADSKKIEQLYYQAVDAYTKDDLAGAGRYLNKIFLLDPLYAPAIELAEKVELAGQKPVRWKGLPAQPVRP